MSLLKSKYNLLFVLYAIRDFGGVFCSGGVGRVAGHSGWDASRVVSCSGWDASSSSSGWDACSTSLSPSG